ncbi:MAG: putative 2-aminoethylphosphonate ABC transporter ATP-binding protein [Betaproteobacteria bacterium]|jgi:iron(III) transport system ATP-binding protein|nr:putative 2-aminoethylphosphonate ABC transporter ATP-binding protein [Casimicrobiaceae bacterium]
MSDSYLSLTGVTKRFGRFTALDRVSLDVPRGCLVTFLGPSGCGKTTLLRIIAGLETQDEGTLVQGGRDISRLPAIRRDYGIVFQSYALFPNLTIFDNVAYGLVNRRAGRDAIKSRVAELLKLVGLPEVGGHYPGQLSGGQQQRIALARALATAPGLLLLDEPLSALDALERLRLRGEIRALQQRLGVTTIMVTHDQEEALSMADHIVVMSRGRIEQVGTPQQIYREPATAFVADFVGKVNVLTAVAQGDGRVRVGDLVLDGAHGSETLAPGTPVKLYLRPEDVTINGNASGHPNVAPASVQKIEFLGAFCLVTVTLAGAPAQPLLVNLSRHSLDRMSLEIGAPLTIGLPRECMRLL